MNTRTRLILGLTCAASLAGGVVFFDGASAQRMEPTPQAGPNGIRGQSATQLSDGRWLMLGGESSGGPIGGATLVDARTGSSTPLHTLLSVPRVDHSATVLSDGSVLITGGRNADGPVSVTELFDPATQTFSVVPVTGGAPRSRHTATLLPDGRVLVAGGTDSGGQPLAAEIWDLAVHRAEPSPLVVDRVGAHRDAAAQRSGAAVRWPHGCRRIGRPAQPAQPAQH